MNARFGVHKVRIYYEDTDHSAVVYHPNYLKYFERAREHLLGPDVLVNLWDKDGIGFAVTKTEMVFKEGARFGDVIDIRTTPSIQSKYRISFDQQVWREGGSKALVLGKVEMVCLDKQNKLVPLPDFIIQAMHAEYGTPVDHLV